MSLNKKAVEDTVVQSRELTAEELTQVGGAYAMSDGTYEEPYYGGGYVDPGYVDPYYPTEPSNPGDYGDGSGGGGGDTGTGPYAGPYEDPWSDPWAPWNDPWYYPDPWVGGGGDWPDEDTPWIYNP